MSKGDLSSFEKSLSDAKDTVTTAESNYNKAVNAYERTKETLTQDLIKAEKDLESAKINYKSAQNTLNQAKSKTSSSNISLDNKKISLEKLQEKLGEDKIIATIDGTITAVNVTVGEKPEVKSLFVIEDMNDLYVSANVMEYDLANISMGQSTRITSDATGKTIFTGEISYISPKATSAAGSTTVEFETHADIIEKNPLLRIGMNAFLDIIIASKENVYAVAYTAITTKPTGENVIYALENNIVTEVPITMGLETSAIVEISGDGLSDGLIFISNPTSVTVGQTVDPSNVSSPSQRNASGGMSAGDAPSGKTGEEMPTRQGKSDGATDAASPQGGAMPSGGATNGSSIRVKE